MPHQCTTCGRSFPDGSKEMLSGCPDCGGNKFQFQPKGASSASGSTPPGDGSTPPGDGSTPPGDGSTPSDTEESEVSPSDRPSTPDQPSTSNQPSTPTETSADGPSASDSASAEPDPSGSPQAAESGGTEHVSERSDEDTAQASARSDVVSPDELDQASHDVDPATDPDRPDSEATGPRPDVGELRDELNEQFESIRIVSPGKYELNLMELYDRQEYIISLQEDGRYVIEMPDAWGISDE